MSQTAIQISPAEILLIEDDAEIRRVLKTTLSAENFSLRMATTGIDGVEQIATRRPDLVVLDLGLPDIDGMDVIQRVRQSDKRLPIIVLSVRGHERDKILALDAGADDFVNKPFATGELLARLRVALRRTSIDTDADGPIFRTGDIEVDMKKRRVIVAGNEVHLTRIEYRLLQILIRHVDQVVTHGQLLTEAWGSNHSEHVHYLRVYMVQLRRKLEKDPARPRYLKTEPGIGYRLIESAVLSSE